MNSYYNVTGSPATGSTGSSAVIRSEYAAIAAGFDLLPPLTAGRAVVVNPGGSALSVTAGSLALAGAFATTGAFGTTLIQQATTALTLPATSDTLVGRATTDTLTNKSISGSANTLTNINAASALTGTVPVANGGTGASSAGIAAFNNITGYTAAGATGGTSSSLVFSTSPTLVTPSLGVASATSINKVALTAPASGSTLTVADGKTLTASNTITLTATDGSTLAVGTGGTLGTAAYTAATAYATAAQGTAADAAMPRAGGTFTGNVLFTDNTYDIGAAGATRPRSLYLAANAVVGGSVTTASVNKVAITAPASSATLTIADGKTLTVSRTMSLTAPDDLGAYTFPAGTKTLVATDVAALTSLVSVGTITTGTWSGAFAPRTVTVASGSTITPTADTADIYTVTALAVPATIAAPSGTPVNGQKLILRILDNGTNRALTWTTSSGGYRIIGVTLPTATTANKTVYVGCIWNSAATRWDVLAVASEA